MRSLFALLLLLLGAAPLAAQAAPYRIRLTEPWSIRLGHSVRAPLVDRAADSLLLTDRNGASVYVPRAYVIGIDSLRGVMPRGQLVRKGTVDGLISGIVVGALFGALTGKNSDRSVVANAGLYAAIAGAGGAVIGAGVGAMRTGEEWETVWPPASTRRRR
jgi:hypothetical protein